VAQRFDVVRAHAGENTTAAPADPIPARAIWATNRIE
jgi:hypothetical protein